MKSSTPKANHSEGVGVFEMALAIFWVVFALAVAMFCVLKSSSLWGLWVLWAIFGAPEILNVWKSVK